MLFITPKQIAVVSLRQLELAPSLRQDLLDHLDTTYGDADMTLIKADEVIAVLNEFFVTASKFPHSCASAKDAVEALMAAKERSELELFVDIEH